MFVDSDDYLPDKAVENMVNANNDDYDLIIGSYYSYNLQSQTKHIFDNAKVLRDTAKYFRIILTKIFLPAYGLNCIKETVLKRISTKI